MTSPGSAPQRSAAHRNSRPLPLDECTRCGEPIPSSARFCSRCGYGGPEPGDTLTWHHPVGVVVALFVPLVGLVIGALWIAEGGRSRTIGAVCLVLSLLPLVVVLRGP